MKVAVFVSGRGSNLQSILQSRELADLIEIKAVISDKVECGAFEIAKKFSVPTFSLGEKDGLISYKDLSNFLSQLDIDLIVLAGFLKLIPAEVVKKYKLKIINIHPALLPSFGGKGMYGMNVHRAVYNSSAKVSGASVHFVDDIYDNGSIIAQECVDIRDVKSPEEIAERVLQVEHRILPGVIKLLAENKVQMINNRVEVSE
ncbi:MAG TPA: phosphoribosylglycinamide formyltransferase [Ignavibacteriaceae bacterium]|nr:phosphoribosylglycinamide formyltransferase [Ignavibacteriaceae bacterium]